MRTISLTIILCMSFGCESKKIMKKNGRSNHMDYNDLLQTFYHHDANHEKHTNILKGTNMAYIDKFHNNEENYGKNDPKNKVSNEVLVKNADSHSKNQYNLHKLDKKTHKNANWYRNKRKRKLELKAKVSAQKLYKKIKDDTRPLLNKNDNTEEFKFETVETTFESLESKPKTNHCTKHIFELLHKKRKNVGDLPLHPGVNTSLEQIAKRNVSKDNEGNQTSVDTIERDTDESSDISESENTNESSSKHNTSKSENQISFKNVNNTSDTESEDSETKSSSESKEYKTTQLVHTTEIMSLLDANDLTRNGKEHDNIIDESTNLNAKNEQISVASGSKSNHIKNRKSNKNTKQNSSKLDDINKITSKNNTNKREYQNVNNTSETGSAHSGTKSSSESKEYKTTEITHPTEVMSLSDANDLIRVGKEHDVDVNFGLKPGHDMDNDVDVKIGVKPGHDIRTDVDVNRKSIPKHDMENNVDVDLGVEPGHYIGNDVNVNFKQTTPKYIGNDVELLDLNKNHNKQIPIRSNRKIKAKKLRNKKIDRQSEDENSSSVSESESDDSASDSPPPPSGGIGSIGKIKNLMRNGIMQSQWNEKRNKKHKKNRLSKNQGKLSHRNHHTRTCILNAYSEYCVGQSKEGMTRRERDNGKLVKKVPKSSVTDSAVHIEEDGPNVQKLEMK